MKDTYKVGLILVVVLLLAGLFNINELKVGLKGLFDNSRDEVSNEVTTYNDIHKIFLDITTATSVKEIEKLANTFNAECSVEKSTGEEKVYLILNKKMPDEYIRVYFDKNDDVLLRVECVDVKFSSTALLYRVGKWGKLNEKDEYNDYVGYYFIADEGKSKEGLVIEKSNGKEVKTNYIRCSSPDEAIDMLLDYKVEVSKSIK